jgi:hypothetical protein
MKDLAIKPLSVSQTDQDDKDIDKEQLRADKEANFFYPGG